MQKGSKLSFLGPNTMGMACYVSAGLITAIIKVLSIFVLSTHMPLALLVMMRSVQVRIVFKVARQGVLQAYAT